MATFWSNCMHSMDFYIVIFTLLKLISILGGAADAAAAALAVAVSVEI